MYTRLRSAIMVTVLVFILLDLFVLRDVIGLEAAQISIAAIAVSAFVQLWYLWFRRM